MTKIVTVICKGLNISGDIIVLLLRHFFPESPRISLYYSLALLSHLLSSIETKCRDSVIISAQVSKAKQQKSIERLCSPVTDSTPPQDKPYPHSILRRKGLACVAASWGENTTPYVFK